MAPLGCQRVYSASLEPGVGEGPLDRLMVAAGPFHGDDEVVEVVVHDGLTEACDGGLEAVTGVGDYERFDQNIAEEVGEHPLGPGLGAVDADDAEVLGPDLLDTGMDSSCGLVDLCRHCRRRRRAGTGTAMGWTSTRGLMALPRFSRGSPGVALG